MPKIGVAEECVKIILSCHDFPKDLLSLSENEKWFFDTWKNICKILKIISQV